MAEKRPKRRLPIMKRKAFLLFIIFVCSFFVLGFKLVKIVLVDGDIYRQKVFAQATQQEGNNYQEAKRGDIVDRNGVVLATSRPFFKVIFDVKLLNELGDTQFEEAVDFLNQKLAIPREELTWRKEKRRQSNYEVVGRRYSYVEFKEVKTAVDQGKIKGVFYEQAYQRHYPYGELMADALGFVKAGNIGEGGVEEYYNDALTGQRGRKYGILTEDYSIEDQEIVSQDGYTVMTHLDYSIQKYLREAIEHYLENYKAKSIEVIVMDPRDGKVLGMMSYPDFNPNQPRAVLQEFETNLEKGQYEEQIAEEVERRLVEQANELKRTMEEERSDEKDNQATPIDIEIIKAGIDKESLKQEVIRYEREQFLQERWKNTAIASGYEPGSIYKAMMYATAIEENGVNKDNLYRCNGYLQVMDKRIHCHKLVGHGYETLEEGLKNSCNVVFMELGQNMGKKLVYDYQHKFNFGALTGIDLVDEMSLRNNLYRYNELNPVQIATTSFGQGFNVTPIQTITAFSSLINGGYLYEPQLMKRIYRQPDQTEKTNQPRLIRRTVSEETSARTIAALKNVVDEGTGTKAKIAGYAIGGKTATSEKQPRGNGKYTVSFIGFAPADNPQILTLVVVDEPEGVKVNSRFAAYIFREAMEKIMPYMHIFRADEAVKENLNENKTID